MTIEHTKRPEFSPDLHPLPSMTYDQMQAAQNAWRMIERSEIAAGRSYLPEEIEHVLVDHAVDEHYRLFRPCATLYIPTEETVLYATLMSPQKWIERAMYCIPDPQEDRMSYERAIADVTNHTFLLHAQAEPGIGIVFDARTIGLISETPGPSRVKIVHPESWTIA